MLHFKTHHACFVLGAATAIFASPASAAFVIDLGGSLVRGSSVSLSANANSTGGSDTAVQTFTVPAAAGTDLLLDSFSFETQATRIVNSNIKPPTFAAYFAQILPNDTVSLLGQLVPAVNANREDAGDAGFTVSSFAIRNDLGERVLLAPGSEYAAFITGEGVNQFQNSQDFLEYNSVIATVSPDGGDDPATAGESFTLGLPAGFASDQTELNRLSQNGSTNTEFAFRAVLVPEPASAVLATAGLLLLPRRRRA